MKQVCQLESTCIVIINIANAIMSHYVDETLRKFKRTSNITTWIHQHPINTPASRNRHLFTNLILLLHSRGGSKGQPREAWLAWNFQRELWFIYFFLRETWLGVPPWNVIGNLYSTWSVIKAPFSTWKRFKSPKIRVFKQYIINARYIASLPWRRSLPGPTTFHWGISRIVADDYMRRVHVLWLPWQRVTTVKRMGGGGLFYELIMALYFL